MLAPPPAPPSEHGVELYRGGLVIASRVRAGGDAVPRERWELQERLRESDLAASFADAHAFLARFPSPCLPRLVEVPAPHAFVVAAPPWVQVSAVARGGALPPELVATYVRDLARGLGALPAEVAVRSLSPRTLAITTEGAPRVLDTTLARFAPRASVTARGVIKGELPYLSPEVARGELADARSDVFSLAVIACELVAGAHPYAMRGATPIEILHAMAAATPDGVPLDGAPPRLAELLRAMLVRDRVERPAMAEVAAALDAECGELMWPAPRVFAEVSRLAPDAAREAILYGY